MTIKQMTELFIMASKIEEKRARCNDLDNKLGEIENDPDLWLSTYDKKKKAKRSLDKAYADFRKAFSESEIGFYVNNYNDVNEYSGKEYYNCARYYLVNAGSRIEFPASKF